MFAALIGQRPSVQKGVDPPIPVSGMEWYGLPEWVQSRQLPSAFTRFRGRALRFIAVGAPGTSLSHAEI